MSALRTLATSISWVHEHCWQAGDCYTRTGKGYGLWLMLEGEMKVTLNKQQHVCRAGEGFLWSWCGERVIQVPNGARWLSLGWRVTLYEAIDVLSYLPTTLLWEPDATTYTHLEQCLRTLVAVWNDERGRGLMHPTNLAPNEGYWRPPLDGWIGLKLADAIFGLCWRAISERSLGEGSELEGLLRGAISPPILAAMEAIQNSPELSVGEVAHHVGLSPAQFRRSFHDAVGIAPRDYLKRVRLEVARQLIESTDLPVSAIANRVGFQSTSHFIELWSAVYLLSPVAYRQMRRETGI